MSATRPASLTEELLKDPEDGTVGLVSDSVGYLECAHSPPDIPCLGEAGWVWRIHLSTQCCLLHGSMDKLSPHLVAEIWILNFGLGTVSCML